MSDSPSTWFDVLQVDPEDVARVGYSLADYALEHEVKLAARAGSEGESVEHQLMVATTLADAATLLVLIDGPTARKLLAQSAEWFERAAAPDAWTLGLASQGAWRPSLDE